MIAFTKAETAALDAVAEARRLIAEATREGTQDNWKRAHDAAFFAWTELRNLSLDPATARAEVLDLRREMLRESGDTLRQLEMMRERKAGAR